MKHPETKTSKKQVGWPR